MTGLLDYYSYEWQQCQGCRLDVIGNFEIFDIIPVGPKFTA